MWGAIWKSHLSGLGCLLDNVLTRGRPVIDGNPVYKASKNTKEQVIYMLSWYESLSRRISVWTEAVSRAMML